MGEKKDLNGFLWDFSLGCFSAAGSRTAFAPIERTRILLQTQNEIAKSGLLDRPFLGFADCWRRIVAREGALGLWRGNTPDIIRIFPGQILNFVLKDEFKKLFAVQRTASYGTKFAANIAAGASAGALSLLFVYPLSYAHTRLAADIKSPGGVQKFTGMTDVFRKTLKTDGIPGLYRGFAVSITGVVVYRALYFGLYDSLKPLLAPLAKNKQYHVFASFALGWGVTLTAGIAAYPFDTVRRRMMIASVKYRSAWDAFSQIIKIEGTRALFKGVSIQIVTSVLGGALLVGYDQLQIYFFGKPYQK